jgi:hypothetical protein
MANPLLREGPIPAFVHGLIEYAAGVAFIVAPLLVDFGSTATGLSVALGILVLVVAATTTGPTSLVNGLTISIHVVLDFALALVLIVAPFVLGFSDEGAPTAMFVGLGIVHLLVTVGTRYLEGGSPHPPA